MGASYSNNTVKKYTKDCTKGYQNFDLRTSLERHFRIEITPKRQKNICECNINELQRRLTEKQFLHYYQKLILVNIKYLLLIPHQLITP